MEKLERRDDSRYVEGGLQLIGEFLKGTFIAGLKDDRVKYIVKAKGEDESLAQLVEMALQEESEVKSLKYKNNGQGYSPSWMTKSDYRGPQIKREVNLATPNVQCHFCKETGHFIRDCSKAPPCYKCNKKGHSARFCNQGNRQ